MAREPSVRPKDLNNTVNQSSTLHLLGSPYNAIHGNEFKNAILTSIFKHYQNIAVHINI